MYHGLSAYSRVRGDFVTAELIERANTAQSVSACWADRPIGVLGLFVDPEHAEISYGTPFDSRSHFGDDGDRYSCRWDTWNGNPYRGDNETGWTFFCRIRSEVDDHSAEETERYAEFWAVAQADAVWVKRDAAKIWHLRAKKLAAILGLPLLTN